MKKLLIVVPFVTLLAACGTTDPYQKRAEAQRDYTAKQVSKSIDQAPDWMTKPPKSTDAVYSTGTSRSGDYAMAVHKAKADAYGKICMTAGGTASQRTKIYKADTFEQSTELSEMVIRTSCKEVDITGVEIAEKKVIAEGPYYRAYVLIALPTGDANVLKKAKDQQRLQETTADRAREAFRELDDENKPSQGPAQSGKPVSVVNPDGTSGTLTMLPVDNAEYRARRDAALKKPGAVIGQVTIQQ